MLERAQEEEDIKKNFKTISKVYDEEDSQFLSAIEQFRRNERKKIKESFMGTLNRRRTKWEELKEERLRLVPHVEPEIIEHEFILEEIIHMQEDVLRSD